MTEALVIGVPASLIGLAALAAYLSVRLERGSADLLAARRTEQPLAHQLPYWTFLDDRGAAVAVYVDLTYSSFAELSGIDTDCLDNEALNGTSHALHGVLANLPAGARLQFIHETDSDVGDLVAGYRERAQGATPVGKALVEAKAKAILATPGIRRSRLLLAVSLPTAPSYRLGGPRKFPSLSRADHEEALGRLRTLRDQVTRALIAAGVGARSLAVAEVRRKIYALLNPARARIVLDPATQVAWADEQSAREQLAFSGVHEMARHLVLDGQLIRVITLKHLPTATEPALLEALLVGLPFHCRMSLAIEAVDSVKALDDLKRRRDQAHLLATLRERRNQEAEAQEEDVAELIDKNLRSSVRMVRLALSVVLSVDARADNAEATLDRQTADVLRLLGSLQGAQGMLDEYNQLDEFLATLPGNTAHGRRWRQCTSENAAHLLLAWQSWRGSPSPALLVHNVRGNLVGLDPFDPELDNPNAFMAGTSGSGKSSTTNYLLLNLLATGAGALVVDVGGSYRRILELFGGQYFAVNLEGVGDQSLNPFFPHADIMNGSGLDERHAQLLQAVIERMVCDRARPELRNSERAVLGAALEATYRRVTDRTPILSDLVETLKNAASSDPEDVRTAQSLARDLRVWVEGPASRLLNRPSNLSLTSRCSAFDLKGLENHPQLQSVVMLILSGVIWNLVMRDPTEKKIVVFDEVWRLLESPASAQVIAELYRTSRKYCCSILTISQSVEDFTGSSIASALTQNSAAVYLLKHRRGHEIVARQFHLNEREHQVFQGLEMRRGEYTEVLALVGEHHFVARVVLSPLEYWIATTHPADRALEERVGAENPGLPRWQLLTLLAERYPKGAITA